MKVKIKFIGKGFFFVGDIGLSAANREVELDLAEKTDYLIATIVNSVAMGKVTVDKSQLELINLIKNPNLKRKACRTAQVAYVEPAAAEVVEVTPEPVVEAPVVVEEVLTLPETPSEADVLSNLLEGGVKRTIEAVTKANLSKEELNKLLELEEAGKSRAAVKSVIADLIG